MGLSDGAALVSVALIFVWVVWTLVHGPKVSDD